MEKKPDVASFREGITPGLIKSHVMSYFKGVNLDKFGRVGKGLIVIDTTPCMGEIIHRASIDGFVVANYTHLPEGGKNSESNKCPVAKYEISGQFTEEHLEKGEESKRISVMLAEYDDKKTGIFIEITNAGKLELFRSLRSIKILDLGPLEMNAITNLLKLN